MNGAPVKLKYVFFKPKSNDKAIKDLYDGIEKEFAAIQGSESTISKWLENNSIELLWDVNKVIDPKGTEESFILNKL